MLKYYTTPAEVDIRWVAGSLVQRCDLTQSNVDRRLGGILAPPCALSSHLTSTGGCNSAGGAPIFRRVLPDDGVFGNGLHWQRDIFAARCLRAALQSLKNAVNVIAALFRQSVSDRSDFLGDMIRH
ncbi:MAG: hypothetical protein JSS02_31210 [Planctomycetes bacterium]|nr:hypothetical protein [Planctomycetota bacterium]